MIDHVGLAVSDVTRSRAFYEAALAPLGITVQVVIEGAAAGRPVDVLGFGTDEDSCDFWIGHGDAVGQDTHVAFRVERREQVHAFHAAAVAAGGRDNGEPGLRPHYAPTYYAAFVFDPDGINVEAVCYAPA